MKERISDSQRCCLKIGQRLLPVLAILLSGNGKEEKNRNISDAAKRAADHALWIAPDTATWEPGATTEMIRYGRALIAHTSLYLGPKGTVAHISNGMDCENCHLQAGTVIFGNNFSASSATYPKYNGRNNATQNLSQRINDCFERSLNGKAIPKNGKEMGAIIAYINWLGKDVKKGNKPGGAGIYKLPYMNRAADPRTGRVLFAQKCRKCHGANGSGVPAVNGESYIYPPLWGKHSFNNGSGECRISNLAGYIKVNMPLGATYLEPHLKDEEAWDIAAYIVSMPRPEKDIRKDWPVISKKPIDYPLGPYSDTFSEQQHKYGPFKQIVISRQSDP